MLRQLREFNEALILALVIFLILQLSIQNFKVEGSSMAATIQPGQYVAVNKLHRIKVDMTRLSALIPFWDASHLGEVHPFQRQGPQRGDIIVFEFPLDPNRNFIKRVIGLPGRTSLHHPRRHPRRRPATQRTPTSPPLPAERPWNSTPSAPTNTSSWATTAPHSNDSRHWEHHFAVHRDHIIGTRLVSYHLPIDLGFANSAD